MYKYVVTTVATHHFLCLFGQLLPGFCGCIYFVCLFICLCFREEMYYKAVHGTAVIFLQNNAGFAKWEPTTERIQELLAAYKISGRSLSSPGPSSTSAGERDSKPGHERSASQDAPANRDNNSPVDKTAPEMANV